MTEEEFFEQVAEVMQTDDKIIAQTELKDLDEWDSLTFLGIISLFDMELSLAITSEQLKKINKAEDLLMLTEGKVQ